MGNPPSKIMQAKIVRAGEHFLSSKKWITPTGHLYLAEMP